MNYAVFPDENYYHMVRPQKYRTFCGLAVINRETAGNEYLPPGQVTAQLPNTYQYKSCAQCWAEFNASKLKDVKINSSEW